MIISNFDIMYSASSAEYSINEPKVLNIAPNVSLVEYSELATGSVIFTNSELSTIAGPISAISSDPNVVINSLSCESGLARGKTCSVEYSVIDGGGSASASIRLQSGVISSQSLNINLNLVSSAILTRDFTSGGLLGDEVIFSGTTISGSLYLVLGPAGPPPWNFPQPGYFGYRSFVVDVSSPVVLKIYVNSLNVTQNNYFQIQYGDSNNEAYNGDLPAFTMQELNAVASGGVLTVTMPAAPPGAELNYMNFNLHAGSETEYVDISKIEFVAE